ncbi:MAG: hypothetical protein DRP85_03375 [Candidatus Makaraimicrobium thalassicum]|nr:MAG: hypothetical protein DRP85_03375 [Candidatus Omnitrophota bacterium]
MSVLQLLRDHKKDELYHPLCSLLDLADEPDATVPDKISIHKTIAKYCEAEKKAIEFVNTDIAPVNFRFLLGESP